MTERLEGWAWLAIGALVLLLAGCWVYQSHTYGDDVVRVKLAIKDDSLKEAIRVRDSVEESIARLEKYAAI